MATATATAMAEDIKTSMIPKHIIEKAIEGGWTGYIAKPRGDMPNWCAIGDPLFWRALGKALEWKKYAYVQFYEEFDSVIEREKIRGVESWLFKARQCYDLLLTDGDTEKFWADLIAKQ